MRRFSIRTGLFCVLIVLLTGCVILQGSFVWNDYAYEQLSRLKRYGWISSVERSSIFTVRYTQAKYLRFLNLYIPRDAPVILPPPEETGTQFRQQLFSSQNMMQFYLFPRTILGCDQEINADCIEYLADPHSFVLAFGSFPPEEYVAGKVFVPFPEAIDNIRGVYAPAQMAERLEVPAPEVYGQWSTVPPQAPLIDAIVLLALLVLGFSLVSLFISRPTWLDILALSFPLAMGLLSWMMFITSFLGLPVTLSTVVLCYGVLLTTGVGLQRLLWKSWPRLPDTRLSGTIRRIWSQHRAALLLGPAVFLWLGLSALIAIGRGYSTFDDIANWCLKGYAIAFQNTIWAGNRWGGHVLAYPMNVQLSISIFRLASGDLLPGSKLLFPILTMSMLAGCYQFWRQHRVSIELALVGLLLIFTIPFFFWYSTTGFANMPFAAYLVLGVLLSIKGLADRSVRWVSAGGIACAFAGWTRPEGIGYGLLMLLAIYGCMMLLLKTRPGIRQVAASLIPFVIPLSWLVLVGARSMRQDQIGSALTSVWSEILQGRFRLDALETMAVFARDSFMYWRNAGYAVPVSILLLVILLPVSYWVNKRNRFLFHLTMLLITLVATLYPLAMLWVDAFNESSSAGFETFLSVSFDRALFPPIVLVIVSAILVLSAVLGTRRD